MTQKDVASCCSIPLSRICLLQAVVGAGSSGEDPSTLPRAGKPGDRPASLMKPLRSQKEKQSIAKRLSLGFTLVPRKSPLGCYMGRPVPAKTCSFRRSLAVDARLGVPWQPAVVSSSTIPFHRASAVSWRAGTALRTGHATDQAWLRGSRIPLLHPIKPSLSRVRPVSSPVAVMLFEPPSPVTREPKPTSRSKLALVKAAIDSRRAQQAECQAAKGEVVKKPLSKELPLLSSWPTILDEEEVGSELDQASLAVPELPNQAGKGACWEDEIALEDPVTQEAQNLEVDPAFSQQPAGATGNTSPAGKGGQILTVDQ
nr:uncharacterized protein LOC106732155 [Pelodiscus sinensis]|eukprot:XP_014430064.1 uncharacterized protein LOC106732155 [Pelodiscus sinensis]